ATLPRAGPGPRGPRLVRRGPPHRVVPRRSPPVPGRPTAARWRIGCGCLRPDREARPEVMRPHPAGIVLAIALAGCAPPPAATPPPAAAAGPAPSTGPIATREPDRARPDLDETPLCFRDVSGEAGVTVPHHNAADGRFRLVETMGSGVGLLDFDGDG